MTCTAVESDQGAGGGSVATFIVSLIFYVWKIWTNLILCHPLVGSFLCNLHCILHAVLLEFLVIATKHKLEVRIFDNANDVNGHSSGLSISI